MSDFNVFILDESKDLQNVFEKLEEIFKEVEEESTESEESVKEIKEIRPDTYYSITGAGITIPLYEDNTKLLKDKIDIGNCFSTKEEAQTYVKYLKLRQKLRVLPGFLSFNGQLNMCENTKGIYELYYSQICNEFDVRYVSPYTITNSYVFDTEEHAKHALKCFSFEELKLLFMYR